MKLGRRRGTVLKFPSRKGQDVKRGLRLGKSVKAISVLLLMGVLAWAYGKLTDTRESIKRQNNETVFASDGDSFVIGKRKFRLTGADAPELRQECQDKAGVPWPCGRAAQGMLTTLLAQPGLSCEAEAADRFGRSLATCKTNLTQDIAAEMVSSGMAVSNEFYGLRDYGDEEDAARDAKKGVWQGEFQHPKEWRAANPWL